MSRRTSQMVWALIAIAVALFWFISTSWRPWDLFDRAGFSSDFYDEQARSFIRGRLAVRPEVPGPEGFLIDGQTYLYYGPFLAIVRVPFALFGDLFVGRIVRLSMLIALAVLGRWSARLAVAGRRVVLGGDTEAPAWPIVVFVGAVLFSPALFASGWISVYHETEIWALTLSVIALTLLAEWGAAGFSDRRRLLWGSGAVLAATLTRAPIGLGLAFGLGCIGLVLAWRSRARRGADGVLPVAGGVVPLVSYAAINLAKFGTLFSVPGDRQLLSLNDPTRAAFFETTGGSFFNAGFLPTTLAQYLRPDTVRFERLVPGIRFGPLAENYGSIDVETVTPASSLPVSATLLLVLAVVGVGWLLARRGRLWLALITAGAIGAAPSFLIGFIANRYLIDMLPPLIVAAAIGVWAVAELDRQHLVRAFGAALIVWGAWVNTALATWTMELKSPGFTELRSDDDDAVFGGGDVGLVDAVPGAPVPRDGIVGLAADCAGVYIAEQGRWVPLDRVEGGFVSTGVIEGDGPTTLVLAETSAWSLFAIATDAGLLAIAYEDFTTGEVVPVGDVPGSLPAEFEVIVDPISAESTVRVADRTFFVPGSARDAGERIAAGSGSAVERSALCEKLDERRS